MATAKLGSTERTNQLLAEASKKTGVTAQAFGSSSSGTYRSSDPTVSAAAKSKSSDFSDKIVRQGKNPDGSSWYEFAGDTPETPTETPATTPVNPQQTGQQAFQGATGGGGGTVTGPGGGTALSSPGGSSTTPSKYQTGFSALSGSTAPNDAGIARSVASPYINVPEEPDTTAVDSYLSQDPGITSIMQGVSQLLNAQSQTSTLMQDYKSLYRESGLDKINSELIDADTVINGTEQNIRDEITTAGGFGTDSQVQAMTLARNKNLLKRYNQLVQMKTDATNQLNTLMSLNSQDKQMAQQRIGQQIESMFQLANFRQNAINNTRSQYQWLATQMGADGLYDSLKSSPMQLSYAERILGVGANGLSKLATTAASERARKTEMENLDIAAKRSSIATDALQRQKIAAEIGALSGKDQKKVDTRITKTKIVTGKVEEARNLIGRLTTGTVGGLIRYVPGTTAYNLNKTVQTIKANIGFDELQAMRDASPTGGALGQVAVQELEGLQSTIASLDTGQDAATLKRNLDQVEEHYINWVVAAAPERLGELGYSLTPGGQLIRIR